MYYFSQTFFTFKTLSQDPGSRDPNVLWTLNRSTIHLTDRLNGWGLLLSSLICFQTPYSRKTCTKIFCFFSSSSISLPVVFWTWWPYFSMGLDQYWIHYTKYLQQLRLTLVHKWPRFEAVSHFPTLMHPAHTQLLVYHSFIEEYFSEFHYFVKFFRDRLRENIIIIVT